MRQSKRRQWKRLAICVLAALLLAGLAAGAGRLGNWMLQQRAKEVSNTATDTIEVFGQTYYAKKHLKTYLIMGIDKAEADSSEANVNNQQADFNALVIADTKAQSYSILYLNRDIMTDVPVLALDGTPYTTRYQQLALAHTYGTGMEDSCENSANTVSELLGGVTVDHYTAFYLDAIGVLNDAVGGVTVTIEDDFSQSDPSLVLGQTITLDAQQAENYVRGRMNVADGTNLNRMKRQMTYVQAWVELACAKLAEDASFAETLTEHLGQSIVTDLSVQQISDLAEIFNDYEQAEVCQLEGGAVQGEVYMEYYLDDEALQKTILRLFYETK